jgi:ribonucleoside-diphosphate reductase alpha chain
MKSASIPSEKTTENDAIPTTPQLDPLLKEHSFARPDQHPFDEMEWETRSASIRDENGKAIFEQDGIEVPKPFSELAAKILASKYFYGDADRGRDPRTGGRESSFKQVVTRVAGTLKDWGLADGYFKTETEAKIFEEDLIWLLINQTGAFNSPVWFNLGLFHDYEVGKDSAKGNFYWDQQENVVKRAPNQYEYPQCSACFIQHVEDDLESIMHLAKAEAMLFKFGSGSGTDLSSIRSTREKLSGGGRPSGPLSFLAVYDSVAGVV